MIELVTTVQYPLLRGIALILTLLQGCHLIGRGFDLAPNGFILLALRLNCLLQVDDFFTQLFLAGSNGFHPGICCYRLITGSSKFPIIVDLMLAFPRIILREPGQLATLILFMQPVIDTGLFGMPGQRLELCLNLAQDILHAYKVILGICQFPDRLLLAVPVFRDAGGLLKECPPLFRPGIEDIINAVLADDAHAIMSDAGIREKVIDILQTTAGTVDVELALAAPIEATGHDYLAEINRQCAIIGKEQGYFRYAQCLA